MTMGNDTTSSGNGKQSVGRKKIEIKRIESDSSRHVSFSKRRAGLFKKAGELCVLCGAEVAIIVKSPGKKFFAFGHPSVDAVLDRFFCGGAGGGAASPHVVPTHEYNRNYAEALQELEEKRKAAVGVRDGEMAGPPVGIGSGGCCEEDEFWWESPIEGMDLEELEQFHASLKDLRKSVGSKVSASPAAKQVHGTMSLPSTFHGINNAASSHVVLGDHVMKQTGNDTVVPLIPHGFSFGSSLLI